MADENVHGDAGPVAPAPAGRAAADPRTRLDVLIRGFQPTQMLCAVAALGVADQLAAGPRTVADLAAAVDADPDSLRRVLRALSCLDVFGEENDDRFRLTPMAELLRSDVPGSVRTRTLMTGADWYYGSWGGLTEAVRRGETAFRLVHGRDAFDFLGAHPDDASLFNRTMTETAAVHADEFVAGCELGAVRVLVDVGGGHGLLAATFLRRYREARAVVFDQPSVVASAREGVAGTELADRLDLVGGDFFTDSPPVGDAYVLRQILHDWSDERAALILRRCREMAPPGTRLFVLERVLDPAEDYAAATRLDVSMLVITGGRERNETEYRKLLASAGWELRRRTRMPTGCSYLEASPN